MKAFTYLAVFVILAAAVSAVTIDPSEIAFEDVLDYAEKTINIRSDKPLQISLSATEPFDDWLIFSPNSFSIDNNGPVDIRVIVQPPEGTPLGSYQGYIIVTTTSGGNELTTSVSTSLDIKTTIDITDEEIIQANVEEAILDDIEVNNPLKAKVTVQNQGNIGLNTYLNLDIFDENKNLLRSAQSNHVPILPLSTEILQLEVSDVFPAGKYYADLKVYADDMLLRKHLLSFNVVEKGKLPAEEKSAIIIHPEPVPLSTGPLFIIAWILVLLFVVYKISKIRHRKRK